MKRVMSDVLPTDCSPRKTNLNFRRGLLKESPVVAIFRSDRIWFGFTFFIDYLLQAGPSEPAKLNDFCSFKT